MRYNVTHEYLNLCDKAKKDPLQYYRENYLQKKDKDVQSHNKIKCDAENAKESVVDEKSILALEKLKNFPLEDLTITLSGFFDRRYRLTKDYLRLCETVGKNPLEYYHENLEKISEEKCCENGMCDSCHAKDEGLDNKTLEELKRFPLRDLRITQKGFFDRRFRLTKDYLSLCARTGKDPLDFYYQNLKE